MTTSWSQNSSISAPSDSNTTIKNVVKILPITDSVQEMVFVLVEQLPSFPGGVRKLDAFVKENINYPTKEKNAGVEGTTYLNFIIEKDGSISHINIVKGIPSGAALDSEAIRIVKLMPKWIPGKQAGKPVRVQFNLPIRFYLYGDNRKKNDPIARLFWINFTCQIEKRTDDDILVKVFELGNADKRLIKTLADPSKFKIQFHYLE
mgnify:FL=1